MYNDRGEVSWINDVETKSFEQLADDLVLLVDYLQPLLSKRSPQVLEVKVRLKI